MEIQIGPGFKYDLNALSFKILPSSLALPIKISNILPKSPKLNKLFFWQSEYFSSESFYFIEGQQLSTTLILNYPEEKSLKLSISLIITYVLSVTTVYL